MKIETLLLIGGAFLAFTWWQKQQRGGAGSPPVVVNVPASPGSAPVQQQPGDAGWQAAGQIATAAFGFLGGLLMDDSETKASASQSKQSIFNGL